MGSEMCIRDSVETALDLSARLTVNLSIVEFAEPSFATASANLLSTSCLMLSASMALVACVVGVSGNQLIKRRTKNGYKPRPLKVFP